MKKLLFLLAVAGMISIVACKSKENKAEATTDTTAVTSAPVDTAAAAATPDTTKAK
jgi:hypothetical protein